MKWRLCYRRLHGWQPRGIRLRRRCKILPMLHQPAKTSIIFQAFTKTSGWRLISVWHLDPDFCNAICELWGFFEVSFGHRVWSVKNVRTLIYSNCQSRYKNADCGIHIRNISLSPEVRQNFKLPSMSNLNEQTQLFFEYNHFALYFDLSFNESTN